MKTFTVTIKPRNYKCTPRMLHAYADEWVGKEVVSAIPGDDDTTFEFSREDYAEGFKNTISRLKIA